MVLLKKTLQVEEKYPYPVRMEAMYEVIDQSPMRKLEKLRQKGFVQKCKEAGVEGQVEEGTLTGEEDFRDLNLILFNGSVRTGAFTSVYVEKLAYNLKVS